MSRQVWKGIVIAGLFLLISSLTIFIIGALSGKVQAAEMPYTFIGLQHEVNEVFCTPHKSAARNTGLVANLGVGQTILKTELNEVDWVFTHHSCAFEEDAASFNAIGIMWKWRPGGR